MVKDTNLKNRPATSVLKCIFITVWAYVNGNTCVIWKKTFQSISNVKQFCLVFFSKKSHFESLLQACAKVVQQLDVTPLYSYSIQSRTRTQ